MRENERGGHEVGSVKREDGGKGMTLRSSKEGWYGGGRVGLIWDVRLNEDVIT